MEAPAKRKKKNWICPHAPGLLICLQRQNEETTSLIQHYFYLPLNSANAALSVLWGEGPSAGRNEDDHCPGPINGIFCLCEWCWGGGPDLGHLLMDLSNGIPVPVPQSLSSWEGKL